MVASTKAWFLLGGSNTFGAGMPSYNAGGGLQPEAAPAVLWGNGTPAAIAPFTLANKGSLYMEVNNTDDTTALWMKVDEGGDTDDWTRVFAEDHALMDTNDFTASPALTVEMIETNALSMAVTSILVDISAADSETMPLYAPAALTITKIDLIWVEATDASGAATGDVTIGTASGGGEIVTAVNGAYAVSQAAGDNQNLTITSGALGADGTVFQSHDQVAEAGTYQCQYLFDFDS